MIEFRNWIDIAKGIGIILVVIGHTIGSQRVNDIIYTFHMPLFFILSGYLLKDIYSIQDFKRNLINKSKRLLIPLLCYMLLIVLPMEINWLREGETTLLNIIWRFFNVYTFAKANAFWFPYSLFLGIIIYNTIQYNTIQYNTIQYNTIQYNTIQYKNKSKKIIIINIILLSIGYILSSLDIKQIYYPMAINRLCIIVPLLTIGHYILEYEKTFFSNKVIIISLLAVIFNCIFSLSTDVDLKNGIYGVPYFSFLISLSWTLIVIWIAKKIEKLKYTKHLLSYIGKSSLTIMFLHMIVYLRLISYLNCYIAFAATLILCCLTHYLFSKFRITRILLLGL